MRTVVAVVLVVGCMVLAAVASCSGGVRQEAPQTQPSQDAGAEDASISADSDVAVDDGDADSSEWTGLPPGYEWLDGGVWVIEAGYVIVDGGTDCGEKPVPVGWANLRTCCNGVPCEGRCVYFVDASTETVCYCAHVVGGCPPEVSICCPWGDICTIPAGCSGGGP